MAISTIAPWGAAPPQDPEPESEPKPAPPVLRASPDRLGMDFNERLALAALSSGIAGFTLGASDAGKMASLRFRAENAHRLPKSKPDWYLYHKSKNYYKAKEAVLVGVRKGAWVAAWTGVFLVIEESMDVFRGTWRAGRTLTEMEGIDELDMKAMDSSIRRNRDFISSGVAGIVTSGLWSAWNTFSINAAARTIRTGTVVGLGYGLFQDGMMYARRKYGVDDGGEVSWLWGKAKGKVVADSLSAEQK